MIRYRTTWVILCQFVMGAVILLPACRPADGAESSGMAGYYYPVESLPETGARYIYSSLTDSLAPPEVWLLTPTGAGGLISINIDDAGRPLLRQHDRLVTNGVLTDSLTLFDYDSTGARAVGVRVHEGNRFPYQVADTAEVFLTHLEWWQPGDSLHVVLQRRRQWVGDTIWSWQGETLPAIRWQTRDQFETERDGWTTSAWTGEEIYARGVGLVYFSRNINPQLRLAYRLERIER